MKIVIVGAGVVGYHLSKTLSWEEHEVAVIDHSQQLVDRATSSLDVMAIRGSGTSIKTQIEAGVENADLLIAVTSVDEVNIVACMIARQLGAKTCIARVRNPEFSSPEVPIKLSELGIDQIIHPELEAAKEVERLIRYPDAIDVVECADAKMILAGFLVGEKSGFFGHPLKDLMPQYSDLSFRVAAISRQGETIIPSGEDSIEHDDIIYVITHKEDLERVFELGGRPYRKTTRDVMLLGGRLVGRLVASNLEKDKRFRVKLIENDINQSLIAAEYLENTIVVRGGEEMDIDLMVIEGIEDMDVFAALSNDDENNIVTSLFARHMRVKRTITLNSKPEYMPIAKAIGLDSAVNELMLTSDAILKHLLGPRILAVSTLKGINAEIVEFSVAEGSVAAGKHLKDFRFPKGAIAGAVEQFGEVKIAEGETKILAGNKLVVFCQPEAIPKLKKLFG